MSDHATNLTSAAQAPAKKYGSWLIFVLGALCAFGPLTIDMYLPALPTITSDLHTTAALTQLSITACLLGLAFGQLFVGSISDVKGRRSPLIIALAVYTVASILCMLAPHIWVFVLLRFLQGATGAAGMVIARACIRDLYSGSELTKYFSLLVLIMGVAPILAPVVGGQLLEFVSWRGIFATLFILGALMFVVVLFAFPETLPQERRSAGGFKNTLSVFRVLATNRVFLGYALTQALVTACMFAYISGSSFALQDFFGLSPQTYSYIFGMNSLGFIIASQIIGRLAGNVSEKKLLMFGLCYASVGGLLLLFGLLQALLPIIIVAFFMVVSSCGIVQTTSFSLAMQNQEGNAGSAAAMIGLLQFTLGAAAAPLVGISGSEAIVPMGVVIAIGELAALTIYFLMVRRAKTRNIAEV